LVVDEGTRGLGIYASFSLSIFISNYVLNCYPYKCHSNAALVLNLREPLCTKKN
jgi:hypothetical protein